MANNDIGELQLVDLQYKLSQGKDIIIGERFQKVLEREMSGARNGSIEKKLISVAGMARGKLK